MENNNKLIAEFMGVIDTNHKLPNGGFLGEWYLSNLNDNNLDYGGNWNLLIPAVRKCKENQILGTQHYIDSIDEALIKLDIDALYDATVKFIEGLNYSRGCYKSAEKE